jgi:glycosyltransferase involved in cell wall biosynthesis
MTADVNSLVEVSHTSILEEVLRCAGVPLNEIEQRTSRTFADIDQQFSHIEELINELQPKKSAKKSTVVVMPAYNAEKTLERTLDDLPRDEIDEIVLVDDGSKDNTVELARSLGLHVHVHEKNTGYGGNQKSCYRIALDLGADYIIMVHPDYQYDSRTVGIATKLLKLDICDMVLGCRIRTRRETLAGGMPVYKYIANRALTFLENVTLGQNLGDFHSGFRAYSRKVLETIAYENNSNDFVFDSQFLAQAAHFGFRMGDIPVPVRYFDEASSISLSRSTTYGLRTLQVLLEYCMHQTHLRHSSLFVSKKSFRI